MQKCKIAVWGGLTNSCEKKRSKKQGFENEGQLQFKDVLVPAEDALVCKCPSGTQILCRHLNEASQQPKKKIRNIGSV